MSCVSEDVLLVGLILRVLWLSYGQPDHLALTALLSEVSNEVACYSRFVFVPLERRGLPDLDKCLLSFVHQDLFPDHVVCVVLDDLFLQLLIRTQQPRHDGVVYAGHPVLLESQTSVLKALLVFKVLLLHLTAAP